MNMHYSPQRRICRGGLAGALPAALLVVALTSAAAPAALAQGEPNAPPAPNGAGTQPAEAGISVTISGAPATSPAKVRAMADRIAITDMDKTVLEAVRDDTKQIDETGLYVALGIAARAAGNVQLEPEEWSQLDRPAYVSLLAEPKRWRGQPLQTTVSIYSVTKMKSGDGLNYSDFWPKDHPVWRLYGVLLGNNDRPDPERPIIIFSVVNPSDYLGEGKPGEDKGETEYGRGRQVRVAALFYKNLIKTERDGPVRQYPVVMAWQLSSGGAIPDGLMTRLAPVAILLVALAGGFYLLRRRMVQMRQSRGVQGSRYQPLRSPAKTPGVQDAPADPADGHVDPELAAAVEQYLHKKGHDETEGTAGAAGKNRHG